MPSKILWVLRGYSKWYVQCLHTIRRHAYGYIALFSFVLESELLSTRISTSRSSMKQLLSTHSLIASDSLFRSKWSHDRPLEAMSRFSQATKESLLRINRYKCINYIIYRGGFNRNLQNHSSRIGRFDKYPSQNHTDRTTLLVAK